MRVVTELERGGSLTDTLLTEHALLHLEADLRQIELTTARLDALAAEVRK
jgi:hypothetical protein